MFPDLVHNLMHDFDVPAGEESLGCTCRWGIAAIFPLRRRCDVPAAVAHCNVPADASLVMYLQQRHYCDVLSTDACITVILQQQLSHQCDVQYLQLMRPCDFPVAEACITLILPQQLRHHYDVPAAEASLTGSQ